MEPARQGRGPDADSDCGDASDKTYYYLTDSQFSVVAVIGSNGALKERVECDSCDRAGNLPINEYRLADSKVFVQDRRLLYPSDGRWKAGSYGSQALSLNR